MKLLYNPSSAPYLEYKTTRFGDEILGQLGDYSPIETQNPVDSGRL
jgi:hypothetical protein